MNDEAKFDEAAAVGTLADLHAGLPADADKVSKLAVLIGCAMKATGLGPGETGQAVCRLIEQMGGRPGKFIVYQPDGGWLDIGAHSVRRIQPEAADDEADDDEPSATINQEGMMTEQVYVSVMILTESGVSAGEVMYWHIEGADRVATFKALQETMRDSKFQHGRPRG